MASRDRETVAHTGSPVLGRGTGTGDAHAHEPRVILAAPGGPATRRPALGPLARLATPRAIARMVWLVGLVSIVSAASPAFHDRVRVVTAVVPSVFPVAATTGTLAAGVVLMLLAGGLRRGKHRAWLLATVLTGFATLTHLLKGLDVEEATLTGAVFILLLTARRGFRALPDPRSPRRI